MKIDVRKECVLDVIGNDMEEFIYPVTALVRNCGYDDVAFQQFLKGRNFIKEAAEVVVEQGKGAEFIEEITLMMGSEDV